MTSKSLSRQELKSRFQTWFDKSNEKQTARLKKLKEKLKYENQLRIEEGKRKLSREEPLEEEESKETNLSRNLKYFNFTA
ncbi:5268_t:CDS:2 [Diversispora eburnea]|uniref:5268_t:CDS:1 n=1 Tax=Diversispora eburnea TaxID=1213867 RepID=A0A9N9AX39_9GLOM|nr:5268_t:CDS:2 [Diversispora eburnea]